MFPLQNLARKGLTLNVCLVFQLMQWFIGGSENDSSPNTHRTIIWTNEYPDSPTYINDITGPQALEMIWLFHLQSDGFQHA